MGSSEKKVDLTPLLTMRWSFIAGSALKILDSSPGSRLFKTPEAADEYIRKERDSWER